LNSDQKDAAQREFETLAAALQEANREARLTSDYSKLAPIAEELKAAQQRLRDLRSKFPDDDGPMSISLTALVAEKIERMFALKERSEARSLLEEDCAANLPFIKKEGDLNLERIRLAVLKLSGGNLSDLKRFISIANVDWRDVLALAEAPEQFSVGFVEFEQLDLATRTTIQDRDHEQYQCWLES